MSDKKKDSGASFEPALQEIFGKLFQITDIHDEVSIENVDLWDSMAHIALMTAIEQKFNIRINPEDIILLTSVAAIRKYLEESL